MVIWCRLVSAVAAAAIGGAVAFTGVVAAAKAALGAIRKDQKKDTGKGY